ncbi:hypothetical protein [Fructilactobacillus fructivorans]|uniref:Uncharacterized protein n=1 Tax=Fructilactobacillus fructivorans TaxID=1614 RepID=A0A0C1M6S4_9LACO|nr:hypothetical protein [Fructilactobacillus fructivorans]KID41979.1 hypothetical protein LfDm3_0647 [Fructilactobacillus fructivorans]KRK57201.1 hypothetical protein FC73_GL001239 [Fructilactobacillus fructivorans]KRN12086.1 hypothetical protein IV37_GL001311 [Fructilactobacillus fructivorans]KRN40446.1 hypothetical protein IV51_GL000152 [Fructilactobacillus fructivorans]KRN42789.1 hypothetical protein IV48_GL001195 [Fructilactobacillus fructivorans]
MKLTDYIDKQIQFLDQQLQDAKDKSEVKGQYLIESKINELQALSRAVEKGVVNQL